MREGKLRTSKRPFRDEDEILDEEGNPIRGADRQFVDRLIDD